MFVSAIVLSSIALYARAPQDTAKPILCLTTPGRVKKVRAIFSNQSEIEKAAKNTKDYFLMEVQCDIVLVDKDLVDYPQLLNKANILKSVSVKSMRPQKLGDLTPKDAGSTKEFLAKFFSVDSQEINESTQIAMTPVLNISSNALRDAENRKIPSVRDLALRSADEIKTLRESPMDLPTLNVPSEDERRIRAEEEKQYGDLGGKDGIIAFWGHTKQKPSTQFVAQSIAKLEESINQVEGEIQRALQKLVHDMAQELGIPEDSLTSHPEGQSLDSAPQFVKDSLKNIPRNFQLYGFKSEEEAQNWLNSNPKVSWTTGMSLTFAYRYQNLPTVAIGKINIKP